MEIITKDKPKETRGRKRKWDHILRLDKGERMTFEGNQNAAIMAMAFARKHRIKAKSNYDKSSGIVHLFRL